MEAWAAVIGVIIAAAGTGFGLYTYRGSVRTRRAEWLYSLYSKFYEEDRYKKTRRLLDYGDDAALEEAYQALQQGDPARSEPIVDYLNFFEFIAGLWVMNELSKEEICRLFDYYLRLIVRRPAVHEFVRSQGFENLDKLLAELVATNA